MKKRLAAVVVALLFVVPVVVVTHPPVADSQAIPSAPQVLTAESRLEWDRVTLDVTGQPETVSHYQLALTSPGGDPERATLATLDVPAGVDPVVSTDPSAVFAGRVGGTYDVWVRAVDAASNASTWSGPVSLVWDTVAPRPPGNLRLVLTVTVGG